ncbi:hypothetical protein L1887_30996 [Cichorium endivia]|nr:hypothetical protein L1887_30996 [Cichorium endivia]
MRASTSAIASTAKIVFEDAHQTSRLICLRCIGGCKDRHQGEIETENRSGSIRRSSCGGIAYATGVNRGRRLKLSGEIERKILIVIFLKADGVGVERLVGAV